MEFSRRPFTTVRVAMNTNHEPQMRLGELWMYTDADDYPSGLVFLVLREVSWVEASWDVTPLVDLLCLGECRRSRRAVISLTDAHRWTRL
jgi:hypothetical protein